MNTLTRHIVLTCCIGLIAFACSDEPAPGSSEPSGTAKVEKTDNTNPIQHPAVELPPQSRKTKRMTVAMLRDSLPIIAGVGKDGKTITWTINSKGTEYDALNQEILGGTMGEPDYVYTTIENTEPSVLYLKFMDDMARDVCGKMVVSDAAQTDPSKRVLTPYSEFTNLDDAADINKNLRYLKLRYFGERLADDDDEGVAELKSVFDAAVQASSGDAQKKGRDAWNTVCIALFLSPQFHIY